MAKEKKIVVNPPAQLERRDSDVALSTEQLLRISLFARLKKKPKPEESPGTLILRRFRKGEVIARQGEAGWTAFYALTGEDVLALAEPLLEAAQKAGGRGAVEAEIERLRRRGPAAAEDPARAVVTVHIALARPPEPGAGGWLSRLGLGFL